MTDAHARLPAARDVLNRAERAVGLRAHDDIEGVKSAPSPVVLGPMGRAESPVPKSSGSTSRRSILETELSNERKALGEAQKSLAQARVAKGGRVNQQEITSLQSAVLDRQQNIQALQRELSRM